ncbi:helix-turn-helix domain-containing protein [Bacillus rubiinfantis]|uniref:helix-turn-helix domain-containing protein n=1 Tax=Bacillus rubiinfantis TaxID=1499680 RepID=UPI001FE5477B|nr:helix-turn-helix transcriptional regulator [Bacillus rubiinfantis]
MNVIEKPSRSEADMLGERIREIRKRKKMTLEALAGEELTKGMLSLIENNKAKPSMESLTYIAKRLDVDITELLEDISTQKLRELLAEAEKLFNSDSHKTANQYQQLTGLIEPYVQNLSQGYESARLLDIYSRSLYYQQTHGWKELSVKAANMYDDMNLTARRANIGLFWAMSRFVEHHYQDALQILLQERSQIEAKHHFIDAMTRVDFDYHEAILHFAVGDSEAAAAVMEKAIQFSNEEGIFYRIYDLYRLAAAHAMMTGNNQQQQYYMLKLKQYSEFAEDKQARSFYDLFQTIALISLEQDYQKALQIIDAYLANAETNDDDRSWYLHEKGKALYCLGQYNEALQCLEKVEISAYIHHPFDLSMLYIKDAYKALCQMELGFQAEALDAAATAVENFAAMPPTPYKDFATKTYQAIQLRTRS